MAKNINLEVMSANLTLNPYHPKKHFSARSPNPGGHDFVYSNKVY